MTGDDDSGKQPDLAHLRTAGGPDMPQVRRLEPGDLFASRYTIEALIGEGGSGSIYKALDKFTARPVALKLIRTDRLVTPEAHARLVHEAVTARDIRHPNVVAVYDASETAGQPYMTMELLSGQSLRAWMTARLRAGAECAFDDARAIVLAILDGLEAAHAQGVIHRDVKPENVFLVTPPADGQVKLKLLDFGIAFAGGADIATGNTIYYRSPEQITAPETVKPSADLYALSVMFYELLVGVLPQGMWQPPSQSRPEIPQNIDQLILSGLSLAPRLRPQSAADYRKTLAASPAARKPEPKKNDRKDSFHDGWTPSLDEPEPAKPKKEKQPPRPKTVIGAKETAKELGTRAAASLYSVREPADLVGVRELHLAAAEKGDAGAMAGLSFLLLNGWGGPIDTEGAKAWAHKAADKGIDPGAVHGQFTHMATAIPGLRESVPAQPMDMRVVVRMSEARGYIGEIKPKRAGSPPAPPPKAPPPPPPKQETAAEIRARAAALYRNGAGSPADLKEARRLYELAVDAGDLGAKRILGYMLHNGLGGPQDSSRAHDLFFQGAVLGDAGAMSNLGFMLAEGLGGAKRSLEQALGWYRKAADLGDKDGMYNYALALSRGEGLPGGKPDMKLASEWHRKLAEAGDIRGMFNYGDHLMFGRAGVKDPPTGREWLRKAAEAGHRGAQTVYGAALTEGIGGKPDHVQARTWLLKAANAGDEGAMRIYGTMLEGGYGAPADKPAARAWYEKAWKAGDLPAAVNLAKMMVSGEGGPKDKPAAKLILKAAADRGHQPARDYLNSLW